MAKPRTYFLNSLSVVDTSASYSTWNVCTFTSRDERLCLEGKSARNWIDSTTGQY